MFKSLLCDFKLCRYNSGGSCIAQRVKITSDYSGRAVCRTMERSKVEIVDWREEWEKVNA